MIRKSTVISSASPQFGGADLLRIYESEAVFAKRNFTEHHHSAFEISYIKSGSGVYRVGDKEFDIQAGDVYLFSTNEVHCITEIHNDRPMVLLNTHFEPRFIWSPQGNVFDESFLRIFLDRGEFFSNRLDRQNPTTKEIASLLLRMQKEAEEKPEAYELMIKTHLLNILVLLIRNYDYVKGSNAPTLQSDKLFRMEAALTYIDDNIKKPITLDEIAQNAGMSRTYFSSTFKKLNGLTPWEYIGLKRIEAAKHLLRHTDTSVLDIAFDCGFNNISHFNRLFKKATGLCPLEYRNKEKNIKEG